MSTSHFVPAQWLPKPTWKTAGLLVPSLLLCSAVAAGPRRQEQHFKVAAHPVITIHNPNGLITVKAWTKSEVMVISTPASDRIEVDAEQMGNRVDVSTRELSDSVAPDDMRADFQINVPEDAELQIHNDAGNVSVANVLGDMNVETVAAGVDLEDAAGYLSVKTVGGSFTCIRCAGRIEASSLSGTSLKGKVNNEAKLTPSPHQRHFMPRWGNALFGTFNEGRAKIEMTSFDGTINILKRD